MALPEGFNSQTDVLVADWTNSENPTMYMHQAQKVNSKNREDIINCMQEYAQDYATGWNRTNKSLLTEWKEHNRYAFASPRAQNIDFDNAEEGMGFWYFLRKAVRSVLN